MGQCCSILQLGGWQLRKLSASADWITTISNNHQPAFQNISFKPLKIKQSIYRVYSAPHVFAAHLGRLKCGHPVRKVKLSRTKDFWSTFFHPQEEESSWLCCIEGLLRSSDQLILFRHWKTRRKEFGSLEAHASSTSGQSLTLGTFIKKRKEKEKKKVFLIQYLLGKSPFIFFTKSRLICSHASRQ